MKNMLKYAWVSGLCLACATGCIEETEPSIVATSDQIAQVASAVEATVNGIYGDMNRYDSSWAADYHFAWGYGSMCMIRELLCNDVSTPATSYDTWYLGWLLNKSIGPEKVYPQYVWNYYTALLYSINTVLETVTPETATAATRPYMGIARAYRAMAWLDMGQMYEFKPNNYTSAPEVEGLTIPYLHEGMTEEEARNNPRLTKEQLLEYIYTDLDLAIEYLDGVSQTSIAMPTVAVAYGLKARAYMWEGEYDKAREAAQNAIDLSGCTPLTEEQWTDISTGFNSASSQNSWMWGTTLNSESNLVRTGILNWTSWMASETTYGYAGGGGTFRMADALFYSQISDTDFRKLSWKAPSNSSLQVPMIADQSDYTSENIPDLGNVKFRPGQGNPTDYLIASATDFPLMRVEEMYFILAECDARNGDSSTLVNFMTSYRDATYTCNKSGDSLINEVLFQKRVELWGEGQIFFDYKRLALPIQRSYSGTNHRTDSCFNVTDGLAPWFNFCFVRTESDNNPALVNNPDPSDTVPLAS